MKLTQVIPWLVTALIFSRWLTELWLARKNRRHVLANAGQIPPAFQGMIDEPTYAKSVQYTLARNRFSQFADTYSAVVLLFVLFSGVLPQAFASVVGDFGQSAWAMAAFLFVAGVVVSLPGWLVDWLEQFRLEARFGFNTTTPEIWWHDRFKGLLLALALGYPLLVLILKCVEWAGAHWWLWAWAALMGFQLLMLVFAPVLILPLFNKFTPLPEGSLRERLVKLAQRTNFLTQNIQVMDGSKRSRHSNAFFTGFGRFRKIVLFDTLVAQLSEPELEAVLAHEIGHYKKKHIPKLLAWSALSSLIGFYIVAWLAPQYAFNRAFGFWPLNIAPALLLFGLLAGTVTFWFSPLAHWWSRRHEYEADAYAAQVMNESGSLIGALRKLSEKNLSNLTPHPIYSAFYYSHPTLLEREQALRSAG